MQRAYVTTFLGCLIVALLSSVARGDESRNETLRFAKGTTGASVTGSITGYQSVNYKVSAKAGQHMVVKLSTSHTATYFNVYPPGRGPGDAALFIGSINGDRFATTLPDGGTYTIQVYMMRSAARRNESADFKLRVEIDSGKTSGPGSSRNGAQEY